MEGETNLVVVTPGCHNLRHGLQNCQHTGVVRRLGGDKRVVAKSHNGSKVRMSVTHRQFLRAHLRFRQLVLAAERHQHRGSPDGGVEHFDQTLLGSHIRIRKAALPLLLCCISLYFNRFFYFIGHGSNLGGHALTHAVGVDEVAAEIHDGFAAPSHGETVVIGHFGDDVGFQVLLTAVLEEDVHIFGGNHHAHALLRFADGHFRAVQTFILRAHRI